MVDFCCVGLLVDDDANGEALIFIPAFPNPEDGVDAGVNDVDPIFPNPEDDDETPADVTVELEDSCKGFGTLYLLDSF